MACGSQNPSSSKRGGFPHAEAGNVSEILVLETGLTLGKASVSNLQGIFKGGVTACSRNIMRDLLLALLS